LVTGAVALLVISGAVAILWSALRTRPPQSADTPAGPASIGPGPRRNGEIIRFENVAGSSAVDLVAQDPETGQLRMFADTSAVIGCSHAGVQNCDTAVGRAAWSTDGQWVAFEATRGWFHAWDHPNRVRLMAAISKVGLWVVGVDGEPRQVAGLCASCLPKTNVLRWAWGPAGTGIAYASGQLGDVELFVMDPSDGTRRSLGRVDGRISALSWSPDGKRIALAANSVLYLVDVASREWSRVATYEGESGGPWWSAGWLRGIKWSPDGKRIALVTYDVDTTSPGRWHVHVLEVEGSELFALQAPGGGSFWDDPEVTWSPDGTRIAYTVYYRQTPGPRFRLGGMIWTVDALGAIRTKVLDAGCCNVGKLHPAWSPNGSQLGFTVQDEESSEGLVVDIDDNGTAGEAHSIDERVIESWRGGWFSSGPGAPGKAW
jgi:hypothetical protein